MHIASFLPESLLLRKDCRGTKIPQSDELTNGLLMNLGLFGQAWQVYQCLLESRAIENAEKRSQSQVFTRDVRVKRDYIDQWQMFEKQRLFQETGKVIRKMETRIRVFDIISLVIINGDKVNDVAYSVIPSPY